MKKILLTLLLISMFAAGASAQQKGSDPLIRKALASGRPTLVDFGASYCIPCKKMKPILDSLQKEYNGRANVIFVDIKQERDMADKYHIMIMPTQLFFDAAGKEVKRHMGFMDKPDIISEFKALGAK